MDILDANRGSGWGLATALLQSRRTTTPSFEREGSGDYGYGYDNDDDDDDREDGGGWEGGPGDVMGMSLASTRGVLSLPYFTEEA